MRDVLDVSCRAVGMRKPVDVATVRWGAVMVAMLDDSSTVHV